MQILSIRILSQVAAGKTRRTERLLRDSTVKSAVGRVVNGTCRVTVRFAFLLNHLRVNRLVNVLHRRCWVDVCRSTQMQDMVAGSQLSTRCLARAVHGETRS